MTNVEKFEYIQALQDDPTFKAFMTDEGVLELDSRMKEYTEREMNPLIELLDSMDPFTTSSQDEEIFLARWEKVMDGMRQYLEEMRERFPQYYLMMEPLFEETIKMIMEPRSIWEA